MTNHRKERINERVKRILAKIISFEVRDKRTTGVKVSSVDVSPDLKHASVLFSLIDPAQKKNALHGLQSAAGYIRSRLAKLLNLRITPELHFKYDALDVSAENLESLIEEERKRNE